MSLARTVADVISQHVTLEVEGIDRMYLNVYQPKLQHDRGVASFFRFHRGQTFASSALMEPISAAFIRAVEGFVEQHGIPLLTFGKRQRKDDVAAEYRARFQGNEGVLFVGKAQEKTPVFRTEKRTNPKTGQKYPWIVKSTAMVNHFYFYAIDEDFGPFFLKFCTSPTTPNCASRATNTSSGNWPKRASASRLWTTAFSAATIHSACNNCATAYPTARSRPCCASGWHAYRILSPFTRPDRAAGYRYDVSILQAEFALTQVLDRPQTGRVFFEEVIRENLDQGRHEQVQLIFNRRVSKRTPGRFRTRVLTQGVTPSLHVDYKNSRIKQYHKEGRALRTETTINNTRDFGIGKRLHNLPALRAIGFQANRRLLHVQKISHDCAVGEQVFRRVNEPVVVNRQRASALRFADPLVQALLSALLVFRLLPRGFSNRELREHWAPLVGKMPQSITQGQMTYHLRRLRLHGLIERLPKSHRYRMTEQGWRTALFCTRTYNRLLRPGLAQILPKEASEDSALRRRFDGLAQAIDQWLEQQKVPA